MKRELYQNLETANLRVLRLNPDILFADKGLQQIQNFIAVGMTVVAYQAEQALQLRAWVNGLKEALRGSCCFLLHTSHTPNPAPPQVNIVQGGGNPAQLPGQVGCTSLLPLLGRQAIPGQGRGIQAKQPSGHHLLACSTPSW